MPQRSFRPEIQALRAVAVLLVLAFHLVPRALPGGYIGVDVFFVISGFLITSHLVSEVVDTGSISLPRFWARRIRRLIPAATVVLIVSFVAMHWVVPRSMWQQTVVEIGASALYIQNWILGAAAVDYLAADNDPTLVQHYWSLSVEEQFYIAWPVLLLVTALVVGRVASGRFTRQGIAAVLSAVFVASLAYSAVTTAANPALAYFDTGARAWEFAAGGLLALIPATWGSGIRGRLGELPSTLASWLGIGLIGAAAVLYDTDTPFPGVAALLPVVGTLLVISGGTGSSDWSPQVLARFGPLQFLGGLSYSIYLWHWPLLIAAGAVLGRTPGWKWAIVIAGASVALAWVTKVLVEDPVRNGRFWRERTWRSFALAAVTIPAVIAASAWTWSAVERGIDQSRTLAAELVETGECYGAAALQDERCTDPFEVPAWLDTAFAAEDTPSRGNDCVMVVRELRVCTLGEVDEPTATVAIVGNSHATHYLPALTRFGLDRGWQILHVARVSCLGVTTEAVRETPDESCLRWSQDAQDYLSGVAGLDAVIFASHRNILSYIAPDDPTTAELDELRGQIESTYELFVDQGVGVMVLGNSPGMRQLVPECIDFARVTEDPCSFDRPPSQSLMTEAAENVPGVHTVDPTRWMCTADDRCHVLVGGVVVLSDRSHLSGTFSSTLAPYLGAEVQLVLDDR